MEEGKDAVSATMPAVPGPSAPRGFGFLGKVGGRREVEVVGRWSDVEIWKTHVVVRITLGLFVELLLVECISLIVIVLLHRSECPTRTRQIIQCRSDVVGDFPRHGWRHFVQRTNDAICSLCRDVVLHAVLQQVLGVLGLLGAGEAIFGETEEVLQVLGVAKSSRCRPWLAAR